MGKYFNYVGPILTDTEYHGMGNPPEYLQVKLDNNVPFRIYCKMDDSCWEEVSKDKRLELIEEYSEKKRKLPKSDYRYYSYDFYLSSLGVR
ncbi:hypothetical protein [Vagococcus fluvialis]|uniref:Uncharacterized protein n=1 Tax=Vagococcus fluvialis TaxID=2738 RepID=A0A7X6DA12_9ENTE|nr:hypothetical protein [Vagococcus fluvialis]NKC68554.1 hypothetical protein [Vagococcus fluvialis]